MNELSFWHRTFNKPFRHEPAVGPESVWKRGEVPRITLDGKKVDTRRIPFWDVAGPRKKYTVNNEVAPGGEN